MLPGIGVFGTGNLVLALVPVLRENGFKIEAIWGRTTQEAADMAKELNIPFHTNKVDDVLLRKDVHLIFIVCPPYLHSQISVKALGIGKHVVCDKPAGLSQVDALKMVRACQYYPSLISIINHSLRFLPAFVQMRKAIQEGYVGPNNEITMIDVRVQMESLLRDKYDWLCDATMGGGTLNLVGSHVVDLVSFLSGQRAVRVHGVVRTYTKTTEHVNGIRHVSAPDFCTFQMELDKGTLVTATLYSHIPGGSYQQEVLVSGPAGHLMVRGGDLFGRRQKITATAVNGPNEEKLYVDVQDLQISEPIDFIPRPYIKGLWKLASALREAFLPVQEHAGWMKEPVRDAATFEDGLYVQAVLEAIRKSSSERSWVKVTIITEPPSLPASVINAARMTAVSLH